MKIKDKKIRNMIHMSGEEEAKVQSIPVYNVLVVQLGTEDVCPSPCGPNFF